MNDEYVLALWEPWRVLVRPANDGVLYWLQEQRDGEWRDVRGPTASEPHAMAWFSESVEDYCPLCGHPLDYDGLRALCLYCGYGTAEGATA